MAFLGGTPSVSKLTLLSPDPLLIHGEHLPIFDLFWEAKNIRYFADTALCSAAPGHLIVLRVEMRVNGDVQLGDSITSCQCGLEVPLSWGEGGSTLVPVLNLLPDTSVPIRSTRTLLCNLHFSFTSLCISYLSSEALNKILILISSYTCFLNINVVNLCSLSTGLSWGISAWPNFWRLAQMYRENGALLLLH